MKAASRLRPGILWTGKTRISMMKPSSTPKCGGSSTFVTAAAAVSIFAIPFRVFSTSIDAAPNGELETVDSKGFKPVVDACTLCDMCFMTKCPYVPPHEFNLDFPHLMLRYSRDRGQAGQDEVRGSRTCQDRPQRQGRRAFSRRSPTGQRKEPTASARDRRKIAGLDKEAMLPKYQREEL